MNVLLLSQFFSTTKGGGEYVFSLIAKNLAKNGHRVWTITNRILEEEYKTYDNIELVFVSPTLEYKGGLPPSFLDNILYTINAIIMGLKIIKNENIDLIHSNNFSPALAGSVLSYLTSKPHITSIHDVFSLCGKNYWKMWGSQSNTSRLNVMLAPFFEKLLLKLKHNCIHTVSEATKDDLLKFGTKKPIFVIHNSIETILIDQNVETDPFQFIYVGRLVFYKNLEVVIKAINVVRKDEPKIKLVIVGDGPHREVLVNLTKNLHLESHIEFKGHVDENEKMKLIASSNALVLPSLCEGFGLVILEAFSQNRPVLVSNQKPMSDIVENEKTGFVLNPHSEKVWAEHIIKLIQNVQSSQKMGENGNRVLKLQYNQDQFYHKIVKMYEDVLGNKHKKDTKGVFKPQ